MASSSPYAWGDCTSFHACSRCESNANVGSSRGEGGGGVGWQGRGRGGGASRPLLARRSRSALAGRFAASPGLAKVRRLARRVSGPPGTSSTAAASCASARLRVRRAAIAAAGRSGFTWRAGRHCSTTQTIGYADLRARRARPTGVWGLYAGGRTLCSLLRRELRRRWLLARRRRPQAARARRASGLGGSCMGGRARWSWALG